MKTAAGYQKITLILLITFAMMWVTMPESHAHSLLIEPQDDQRVLVQYDGGGLSRRTVVTVLDPIGQVLEEGKPDQDGFFEYSHLSNAHTLRADDGLGHRAEWVIGTTSNRLPKLPVTAGVWGMFGGVAWHFKRKQSQQS